MNIWAVKFTDNNWYRAIVLCNNVENRLVTVRYLDYANIEEVSISTALKDVHILFTPHLVYC